MIKEYSFSDATSLTEFLEEKKKFLIGQEIVHFYSGAGLGSMSESPAVFELENFSIIIHYFWLSDIVINITDTEKIKNDLSLNFLYTHIPESRNLQTWVSEWDAAFVGCKIADISIDRFSDAFEGYEPRPSGGDYFSTINVTLDNGNQLHLCAADALFDGYMYVWY